MARERKANNAQSTLSGAIDSVVTSLDVVDASSFPTLPQFRLKINNELMLVTAVSTNTFTVLREQEGTIAAAHADGDDVTLPETKVGQLRHLRDWFNPLAEVGKPMQLLDASGNNLTASDFDNINMGSGTKTDLAGGAILLESAVQSTANSYKIIKRTAPATPYTLTVGFIPNLINAGTGRFPSAGPVFRENSSAKLYAMRLLISDDGVWTDVIKLPNAISSSTAFIAFHDWSGGSGIVWFQIEDDGTNVIFRVSADGVSYLTIGQESRTNHMAGGPDEIGFAVNNFGNTNLEAQATLVSWDVS